MINKYFLSRAVSSEAAFKLLDLFREKAIYYE
jgi:hypothetical protein